MGNRCHRGLPICEQHAATTQHDAATGRSNAATDHQAGTTEEIPGRDRCRDRCTNRESSPSRS